MTIRPPAPSASIVNATDASGKLHAPSAARNATDLCAALQTIAPTTGNALEIASGTGQHIVTFAAAMTGVQWQPSEVEASRLNSITAYVSDSGLSNISEPFLLNATRSGWSKDQPAKNLITLANLLHLISALEVETLLDEAAKTLAPKGTLALYGPFKRDGVLTSEGDMNFDASLRAHDPETGYKDDTWIIRTVQKSDLVMTKTIAMPANNLLMVFQKQ